MIVNLSGLKAVYVFYGDSTGRCCVMREQFVGRDRRESPALLRFMRGKCGGSKTHKYFKQEPIQRRVDFSNVLYNRLAKPAFFRYNESLH